MVFTDDEKRMLQGEAGIVAQKCMEYLADFCIVTGAERLINLDGTGDFDPPQISMAPLYAFSYEDLKQAVDQGATFRIPTFANKSASFEQPPVQGSAHCAVCTQGRLQCKPENHETATHDEWDALYRRMGMIATSSCATHLTSTYWPAIGQHCSWNESTAIPYCNAVLGARTNMDGSFATCFLGKAAYYDMHITENRYATVLVKTERVIRSDMEWDVFGFAAGECCGVHVPCFTGTAKPTTTQLSKLNSALNTVGAVRMYHIPGTTPEAPTLEYAFNGKPPTRVTMIGEAELKKAYERLNSHRTDDIDMVFLGCPHYNIVDMMLLAQKLEGLKFKVPFWIMTTPWLLDVARNLGYLKVFENTGARLMTGTCLAAMGGVPKGVKKLAVDSAKQSYDMICCYPDKSLQVCYGDQDDCIDAALIGKWCGEWK